MRGSIVVIIAAFNALLVAQTINPLISSSKSATAPQHATVRTSASATTAARGSKVSLYVDVVPDRGIHVYAPGAKDYQPIALNLTVPKGVVAGKTLYPASQMLVSPDEAVPVFQQPFRLTREITVPLAVKPGTSLAIAGTVEYQACDDKVCFVPASLPVSWAIAVK
jgi:DsbC/DsbD-like thiol-disulfide interchange protein